MVLSRVLFRSGAGRLWGSAPRSGHHRRPRPRAALREAVAVDDAPTVVRYPKGALPEPLPAIGQEGSLDVLSRTVGDGGPRVLAVGVGAMAHCAVAVAEALQAQGIGATVVDPRWVLPVSPDLVTLPTKHDLVVVVEDGLGTGGIGSAVRDALAEAGQSVQIGRAH